jgi:hypothetical protein
MAALLSAGNEDEAALREWRVGLPARPTVAAKLLPHFAGAQLVQNRQRKCPFSIPTPSARGDFYDYETAHLGVDFRAISALLLGHFLEPENPRGALYLQCPIR